MSLPPIPNLIFSTRAENPQLGSEFNREVVAESPDVPDDARALFGRSADITLKARSKGEKLRIFIFRRVRKDLWLFSRVISLGLHRKGSHHLLVHGLLLKPAHLDAVEGNPFLLDRMGILAERHPGETRRINPIELPDEVAKRSRSRNVSRFDELTGSFARESDFRRLYESLSRRQKISHQLPEPSPDWVEWMLLHFHPYDRVELSFHSWAVDGSAEDYDLSLVPESESRWNRNQSAAVESKLAEASERLRAKGAEAYLETLDTYLLTRLSRRETIPLTEEEARLAFLKASGEPLTAKQKVIVEDLFLRGLKRPARAAEVFGNFWKESGFERFNERFAKLVEQYPEVVTEQLPELRSLLDGDLRRIWVALELVRLRPSSEIDEERLLKLWQALVPPARCAELLDLFPDRKAVEQVQDALKLYVRRSVERFLASDVGARAAVKKMPYWPVWEEWTARHGAPLTATVGTMEDLVAQHSADPGVAAERYRELAELAHRRGEPVFGYRLTFQRELATLARVGSEAQRQRLEELIYGLVEARASEDEIDSRLKALRFFLMRPPLELLGAGAANARALLLTVLLAVLYRTRAGEITTASEVLQRLKIQDSDQLVGLLEGASVGASGWLTADDWAELLFDDLLLDIEDPGQDSASRWHATYEACWRLTWWLWAHGGAERSFVELRLRRLFEIGSRLGKDPSTLRQLVSEFVPHDDRSETEDGLFERLQTVYFP